MRRGLDRNHRPDARRVKWKVQARASADFQDTALGGGGDALADRPEILLPHCQLDEPRHDVMAIKAHGFLSPARTRRYSRSRSIATSGLSAGGIG